MIKTIIFFAFLIRFLFVVFAYIRNDDFLIFHSQDSYKYIELAKSLAYKSSFTFNNSIELERLPGYPLFLSLGVVFGHLEIITILVQILLSCLSVYLIYKIANLMFKNEKVAIISSIFYSIEPLSILYASKIMTETLFITLFLLFFYIFLVYLSNKKLSFLIFSSFVLAMSAYVRPVSIYLGFLFTLFLFLYLIKSNENNMKKGEVFISFFNNFYNSD